MNEQTTEKRRVSDNLDLLVRKLEKHCAAINKILKEAEKVHPKAELFLEGNSLHLMSGESHDERGQPHPERSLGLAYLMADGGGW